MPPRPAFSPGKRQTVRAPLIINFMLPVPDASVPAAGGEDQGVLRDTPEDKETHQKIQAARGCNRHHPHAPAVEICSDRSQAGMIFSASETR